MSPAPPSLDALEHASDARVVARTADRLAVPRASPADSFVLHSALELLARQALLPFVAPGRRSAARGRIWQLGHTFESFGPPIEAPRALDVDDVEQASRRLIDAVARGELDDVDVAAAWLGDRATPEELRHHLADALVPSLAAAGHAPIFLYLLPRIAPRGETTGQLLRQLMREAARQPTWRLSWFDHRAPAGGCGTSAELVAALEHTPRLGEPVSTFIHPLMSRIDTPEAAGAWLSAATRGRMLGDRPRALLRVAARSMIVEPTRHAPYGWSHCLTMPQAVLGIAGHCTDPSVALAVAATYVAGFRTLADGPLVDTIGRDDANCLDRAIEAGARPAATAAWHGTLADRRSVIETLATQASVHDDAHLAKYTLACIDAAAADPDAAPLFMAAAASLAGWWAADARA